MHRPNGNSVRYKMVWGLRVVVPLLLCCSVLGQDQLKVVLPDGSEILGTTIDFNNEYLKIATKIDSYLGIPYAEPPVGPLRFRPPVRKGPLDAPLDALKYGDACIQTDIGEEAVKVAADNFSEDCLYLDVLVPNPLPDDCEVLVNIHGGGLMFGSGAFKVLSLTPLVAIGNFIVVSMNYRLNAFGFLTTGDDVIPGNLGLLDQQMSLQWVQDNIAAFGGNPEKVTIIGESAGGASVGFQLLSPGSKGLFRNAITESGSPVDNWCRSNTAEQALDIAQTLATLCGCSEDETAEKESLRACLQRVPAEEILSQEAAIMEKAMMKGMLPYPPVVDGTFITKSPADLVNEGAFNRADVIVGTNYDEGTLMLVNMYQDKSVTPHVNTSFLLQLMPMVGGVTDPTLWEVVRSVYTEDKSDFVKDNASLFQPAKDYLTDLFMLCSQNDFADGLVKAGLSVHRYCYTHVASRNFFNVSWAGAAHGDEMLFTYGVLFELMSEEEEFPEEEKEMALQTLKYYTNFIKTGNPNSEETDNSKYPSWPKWTADNREYKDLSLEMNNGRNLHARRCYFLQQILPKLTEMADQVNQSSETSDDEIKKWTEEGQCEGDKCL